jgi:hypothetical protein
MKPQMLHDGENQFPFHLIKSFLHIHFKKHETTFSSLEIERMKKFMGNDGIVLYIPLGHKS